MCIQRILARIGLLAVFCVWPMELIAQKELTPGISPRLGISPSRIELQLNKSGQANSEFTVLNMSDRQMPVEMKVTHWDLDENSQVRVIPPTEQSLDQWLLVNPLTFVVPPNGSQTVRFGIRPKVQPLAGEHRAMVYIRELPDAQSSQGLSVSLNYGLPIYANFGEVKRSPVLHDIKLETLERVYELVLDIENTGNAYVRPEGRVGVWPQSIFPGEQQATRMLSNESAESTRPGDIQPIYTTHLLSQPVLGGTRRQQVTRIPRTGLENESLVLLVIGEINGLKISKSYTIAN